MSDETLCAPGFTEDERTDASASAERRSLQSGAALSVLWWIEGDDAPAGERAVDDDRA